MARAGPGGALALAAFLVAAAPALAQGPDAAIAPEDLSLFGFPAEGADFETLSEFRLGNAVFRQKWAPAGEGSAHFDGLGPIFNARSCESCHVRDGRGRPPDRESAANYASSMLVKLGRPVAGEGAPMAPDPVYGHQIQDFALPGITPEGRVRVDYDDETFAFPDGGTVVLRRPRYSLPKPGYGALAPDTVLSGRIAPQMIGLGLIARVPEADIVAGEDPDDADGDGISGRANRLSDGALGRFGWKAGQPTLEAQVSLAFSRDMGLSTPLHQAGYGDCTPAEAACREAPDGASEMFEGLEAHSVIVGWTVTYAENLAVPERRGADDPDIVAGGELFAEAGCPSCHRPGFVTGPDPDQPHLGTREIAPYSDLLLHDMGEGLADGFVEGSAGGSEWRTAPLWGIGLTEVVNGNKAFLHDGRARTIAEAIVWHGGEAAAARDAFAALDEADRARLIAFVGSL